MSTHCTDIIELGVPFTDPIADGPTIQTANTKALENGVTVTTVLEMVRSARNRGLRAPIMLMGYYNPMLRYGEERMLRDCKDAGVNGFIMVDLPPEEAVRFRDLCTSTGYVNHLRAWQILSDSVYSLEVDCANLVVIVFHMSHSSPLPHPSPA
jgi:tryptophan synthase alpha subunit